MMNANNFQQKCFNVSDYFPAEAVVQPGTFRYLDEVDTVSKGALVYCQNLHYLELASVNSNISAIIAPRTLANEPVDASKALVLVDDPRMRFFKLYANFQGKSLDSSEMQFGISKQCQIHPSAIISDKAFIGKGVEIAANVVVGDYVRIMDDTYIGHNAVIGAEGLLTLRNEDGSLLTIKHAGGVEIGRGCQVLAGAVIAKSLFRAFTRIGDHCQIGIMTNIGHGASIGEGSVISGSTVIAGRTKVGRNVWVGTAASVSQGLDIGDGAQIKMGSVVIGNVAAGQAVSGNFAVSHKANMRQFFKVGK